MKEIGKRRLIYVSTEDTILHAVQQMRDSRVSCVLVVNGGGVVVGIITERDIVQKFTLLDVQDKLMSQAGVFMTRPVHMAHIDSLASDVRSMFFEKGIRHFPVTSTGDHALKSLVGIMTVTDLAGAWFNDAFSKKAKIYAPEAQSTVVVVCEEENTRNHYRKLFEALQFETVLDLSSEKLVEKACREKIPLVLDLDGIPVERAKVFLKLLKESDPGIFVLLSSQPQLVQPLQELLKGEGHFILKKPLDISYILQLLQMTKARV